MLAETDPSCDPTPSRAPSAPVRAELVDVGELTALAPAWRDLVARSLESNVFLDPDFAIPAFAHLYERSCRLIVVTQSERLLGLMPLLVPAAGRGGLARLALHAQAALGTPLVDAEAGERVFAAVAAWLRRHRPDVVGLAIPRVPQDGAFFAALERWSAAGHGALALFDAHARAILPHGETFEAHLRGALSSKKAKDLRRQGRRLAGSGELTFVSTADPAAIGPAVEAFLALEGRGWKGGRRTALVSQPRLATFARAMTRAMARRGACRVDALLRDGEPVAMGVVLRTGKTAAFWKTAYDERLARLSPGVQLALRLTARQLADPATAVTDSCAMADHPMIDRIWPARMALVDAVLPLRPAGDPAFVSVMRREAARRRVRRILKRAAYLLRGDRPS